VSDIHQAVGFYEGKLGLPVIQRGPSAHIPDGRRVYGAGGGRIAWFQDPDGNTFAIEADT
jgi:catechol 2,3-dioxygenase-like lactoylglutathione lyase family enzyme